MTQNRAVCTIIAKNYVSFARTMLQSFLTFHPDYRCYVLIVDDYEGFIDPRDECFEIVKLAELGIPNLPGFCFKYDLKEVCTAAKANLLEYLVRKKSVDRLVYLDPDILVTAPLTEIYEKLATYDVVLTPHLDTDYPDDDLLPDDGYILSAGQFNLGFIGINSSENSKSFLNWWKPKLYKNCVIDLMQGYFVDQKFIDFVPIFFKNILVESAVGYNVAYWNLHSRKLSVANGGWKCNDGPLYFFHFSGYDPDSGAISRHLPTSQARHLLSNRRDLKSLFDKYKNLLINNGHKQTISWPYTFASFKSGEPISHHARLYYRSLPGQGKGFGNPFESEHLKRQVGVTTTSGRSRPPQGSVTRETHTEQLNAILNSRAWRWVGRYGRFKDRYLAPVANLAGRFFGTRRTE